jgi:8-oxo-dGTP pyrophosphatase MutT (NUDIX family)
LTIQKWLVVEVEPPQSFRIFRAQWRHAVSPRTGETHSVIVLTAPDWVNVVALTPDDEVVMVEQYRHGIEEVLLEVPGGMVERGEAPSHGGARELLEETGYAGDAPTTIGAVHPNPAFLSNRCHTVVIRNARLVAEQQLDSGEDIAVHLVPVADIPAMIRDERITHALVIAAFYHAGIC